MEPHVGEPTESLDILGWGRNFECKRNPIEPQNVSSSFAWEAASGD
jgi:hypothetical protein